MYEELINLLRRCGKQKCEDCEYEHVLGCVTKMNEKAADAIEGLSMKLHGDEAAIAGMKREIERMVVSGNKPRWIPVTERLPEPYVKVLTADKHGFIQINWVHPNGSWSYFDIRYWMPLPEPPKDGVE